MFEDVKPQTPMAPTPKEEKDWGPFRPKEKATPSFQGLGYTNPSAGPAQAPPQRPERFSPTVPPYTPEPPSGPNRKKVVIIVLIIIVVIIVLLAGAVLALNYFTKKNTNNANANENVNVVSNVNKIVNINTNVNKNVNTVTRVNCESTIFQCDSVTADTNKDNKDAAQCTFGGLLDKERGRYINCTIKNDAYIAGSNAEIILPLSTGQGSIKFSLPSLKTNLNVNTSTNVNLNANTNGNVNAALDPDNDGLTDAQEIIYGTDPKNPDTDGDSYLDGEEVQHGYNPNGPGKL